MLIPLVLGLACGVAFGKPAPTPTPSLVAAPKVSLAQGTYLGFRPQTGVEGFRGIRYATPPVGELRFTSPVFYNGSASEMINATEYGLGCPQIPLEVGANGEGEDCLTLNIARPANILKNQLLPVMFWIHGGGNTEGQGMFWPGYTLVNHSISIGEPIVYVSINYRLGGYGWLNSAAFIAAGITNLGLKDQYLALEWVQKNIGAFGGDPRKVTIFGESAGSVDVFSHLHYAQVKNEKDRLFRGAIAESGAPVTPLLTFASATTDKETDYSIILAATNCSSATNTIECLRQVPAETMQPLMIAAGASGAIDGEWFSDIYYHLDKPGVMATVPLMHGSNLNEGSYFMPDMYNPENQTALIASAAANYFGGNRALAEMVVEPYFKLTLAELGKGYEADVTAPNTYYPPLAFYTDSYMDVLRRVVLKSLSPYQDVWGYTFRQHSPLAMNQLAYEYPGISDNFTARLEVFHESEVPYVFGDILNVDGATDGDKRLSNLMMSTWISFVNHLNPNQYTGPDHPNWPKYDSSNEGTVMIFQDQGGVKSASGPDTLRNVVYGKWNAAYAARRIKLGA